MNDNMAKRYQVAQAIGLAKIIKELISSEAIVGSPEIKLTKDIENIINRIKVAVESDEFEDLSNQIDLLHNIYNQMKQKHKLCGFEEHSASFSTDQIMPKEVKSKMHKSSLGKGKTKSYPVVNQDMVSAIVKIILTKGDCSQSDLEKDGFSKEELKLNWAMSYGLANVELMWHKD